MCRGQHALCLCDHAAAIASLPRSFARAYECNCFGFQKPRMKSGERKGDRLEGYVLTNEHTLSVWAQFGRRLRSTPSVFSQLLALSTVLFLHNAVLKQQDTPLRFQKNRPLSSAAPFFSETRFPQTPKRGFLSWTGFSCQFFFLEKGLPVAFFLLFFLFLFYFCCICFFFCFSFFLCFLLSF